MNRNLSGSQFKGLSPFQFRTSGASRLGGRSSGVVDLMPVSTYQPKHASGTFTFGQDHGDVDYTEDEPH